MSFSSILKGDHRALAKAITLFENEEPESLQIARAIFPHTGVAFVIGVTGPPGTGKSTLVDKLIKYFRDQKKSVGVLAIDPSSAFTGGAMLGDRLRMTSHNLDPDVFIRSMASRGGLGGLAKATRNAIRVLDASGKDIIIVETAGAGQSEIEIVRVADATVVVTVPQLGDEIQVFKAGLMEIGDIFVVNMSDLPGADRTASILMIGSVSKDGWKPPIVRTIAKTGEGVEELARALEKRREFMSKNDLGKKKELERLRSELAALLTQRVTEAVSKDLVMSKDFRRAVTLVSKKKIDPDTASRRLFAKLWKN